MPYRSAKMERYPKLKVCRKDILAGYSVMEESYRNEGKLKN